MEVISDEILLHTCDDQNEHKELICTVLEEARKNGATLNRNKIQLMSTSSVKYMGDIFTNKGILTDPSKIQAINEMSIPKTKSELKRFL